jgi:hypothetical protein
MSLPDAHMSGQEEPVAPHLPQAVDPDTHALSTAPAPMKTRREKRRREWHERKLSASREKIQRRQDSLLVAGSSRTESHSPSATGGKQRQPSYGRTESQRRVIEELKICASCLTRTTPPHGLRKSDSDDSNHQHDTPNTKLLMEMSPPTPLITSHPRGLIEEDLGSIEEHASNTAVMPDPEGFNFLPRVTAEDWDNITVLHENRERRKLPWSPNEDLTSSRSLVDKLLGTGEESVALNRRGRSWSLHSLSQSPVEAMEENPQELGPPVGSVSSGARSPSRSRSQDGTTACPYCTTKFTGVYRRGYYARHVHQQHPEQVRKAALVPTDTVLEPYEEHHRRVQQEVERVEPATIVQYAQPQPQPQQYMHHIGQTGIQRTKISPLPNEDKSVDYNASSTLFTDNYIVRASTSTVLDLDEEYQRHVPQEAKQVMGATYDRGYGESNPEQRDRDLGSSGGSMECSCESPVHVPQTEEISWNHVTSRKYGHHSFAGSSSSSSYARSVFTTASVASSATDLSRNSGYSAVQIAMATKELIRILQDDESLVPLYKRAMSDVMIGPSRLERNLRRIFQIYAEHLGDLAGDRLEYLASRLVRLKAKLVARSIMEKYDAKQPERHTVTTSMQEQEQSSDEDAEAEAVDETEFDDLASFRDFLVGSEAFEILHTQMRSFVLPKIDQAGEVEEVTTNNESNPEEVEVIREEKTLTTEDPGPTTEKAEIVQKYIETITEDLDTATNDDKTIHTQNLSSQFNLADSTTHAKARTQVPGRSWPVLARVRNAGLQPEVAEDVIKNVENTTDIKTNTSNVRTAQSVSESNKVFAVQGESYVGYFWSIAKATGLVKNFAGAALVASKCLEPALRPGYTRLRWQCVSKFKVLSSSSLFEIRLTNDQGCGDTFYEDIWELREGGVVRLTERMQSSMGIKAIATPYNQSASNQKYTFAAPSWVRGIGRKVSGVFNQSNNTVQGLPQHTSQTTTSTCAPTGSVPVQRSLHLIACMRHDRYRRILYQDPIDKISTDKELFSLMRAQLAQRRGAVRNIFSCTRIQGLRLIKVRIPLLTTH